MRRRTVFPEDAGIGLMPARLAKAASVLMRPGCDYEVSATAAVTGPIPGCWRRVAAGLCRTRSVIRLVTSLSSLSSAVTRLASLIASPCAVWVARSSLRVLHVVIVTICVAVSGWRASMPRSTTRSSAVSALIVAVRSVLMWSREASSTLTAARRSPSARGSRGRSYAGPRRPRIQHPMRRALDVRLSSCLCVPRQVVGRVSSCLKVGMVALARPRWTSRGRFQVMVS